MFGHTIAAIRSIIDGFKKMVFAIGILLQLSIIAYLGYALYASKGNLVANVILISLAVAYLIFELATKNIRTRQMKDAKKIVRRAVKYAKILVRASTLAIVLYGVTVSIGDVTAIELILIAISLISWIMQVVIELVTLYVESQLTFLELALKTDFAPISRPVTVVGDAIKKMAGVAVEKAPEPSEAVKKRLDKAYAAYSKKKSEDKTKKREILKKAFASLRRKKKPKPENPELLPEQIAENPEKTTADVN
jgi:hypothetical protein